MSIVWHFYEFFLNETAFAMCPVDTEEDDDCKRFGRLERNYDVENAEKLSIQAARENP